MHPPGDGRAIAGTVPGMARPGEVRVSVLRGPDHETLGEIALEEIAPSLALALSRGRFPKGYPHLDPNEDGALAATDGATAVLAVVDGHNGFEAASAALQAVADSVPVLLAGGSEAPREALLRCFEAAGLAVAAALEGLEGEERGASGTALAVAVVGPGRLTLAGLGDCLAVVIRGSRVKRIGVARPLPGPRHEALGCDDRPGRPAPG